MAGRLVHDEARVTHPLDPPLQVQLPPLHLLLLVVDAGAGEEVEQQEDEADDDDDADGEVGLAQHHLQPLLVLLGEVDEAGLRLGPVVVAAPQPGPVHGGPARPGGGAVPGGPRDVVTLQ